MTAKTATAPKVEQEDADIDEIAEILQTPKQITISGIPCLLKRLRTREFLKLMNILTAGMGGRVVTAVMVGETEADLVGRMGAALLNAVPAAADETLDFIRSMVEPAQEKAAHYKALQSALDNPDLDIMFEILTGVLEQEASELVKLGKATKAWWQTASAKQIFQTGGKNGS